MRVYAFINHEVYTESTYILQPGMYCTRLDRCALLTVFELVGIILRFVNFPPALQHLQIGYELQCLNSPCFCFEVLSEYKKDRVLHCVCNCVIFYLILRQPHLHQMSPPAYRVICALFTSFHIFSHLFI